jgi:hypothetical protein
VVAAALLLAALISVPQVASAGDWGATVTQLNQDGRLEQFWVGGDGAVWHRWQLTVGGTWSGNNSLGGHLTSGVGVTRNQDGRLEIFGRADGGDLDHMWQLSPGGGWSGWASLGGQLKAYTGVYANYFSNNGGTIRVEVTGVDNQTHYLWQLAPNCCWSTVWT